MWYIYSPQLHAQHKSWTNGSLLFMQFAFTIQWERHSIISFIHGIYPKSCHPTTTFQHICHWNEANEWDETCTSFVQKTPLEYHSLLFVYLYFMTLNNFLFVQAREQQYLSLMYIMDTIVSNNTSSYTHVCLYMVWRV